MDNLLFQLFTIKYNKTLEDCDEYHEDLLNVIFIIKEVIDNNLNIDIVFNEDDDTVKNIILNNQNFFFNDASMNDINERKHLLIDDVLKNYMIEIARILKLNDEDYPYIYLLLVCSNYTEMKTLDSRITDAIDAIYSTLNLSCDNDDLKFYQIIEKLMICNDTNKSGKFKGERCHRTIKLFNEMCTIHSFKTNKSFNTTFLQVCWSNKP